jgi:hypothetical protein
VLVECTGVRAGADDDHHGDVSHEPRRGTQAEHGADAGGEDIGRGALVAALKDTSAPVRIAAARALVDFGPEADAQAAFTVLLDAADWSKNDVFTAMSALDALNAVGQKAAQLMKPEALAARIKALPDKGPAPDSRCEGYIPRILEELRERIP